MVNEPIPQLTRELTDRTRALVELALVKRRRIYCGGKLIFKMSNNDWLVYYEGQTPRHYNSMDEAWQALLANNPGDTPWIQPMNANVWAVVQAAREYVEATAGFASDSSTTRKRLLAAIEALVVEE